MSATSRTLKLAIATAAAPLAMSWAGAALALCPPADTPADLLVFAVEGPVSLIAPATVAGDPSVATVLGVDITVPDDLGYDTGFVDPITGEAVPKTADDIVNGDPPTLDAKRGYQGGTIIAEGLITTDGTTCTYDAETAFFEFAENVLLGVITDVDPLDPPTWFEVDGQRVEMNPDLRVPSILLDIGGNDLTLEELANADPLGKEASVEGYFIPGTPDVLYAKLAETGVVAPGAPGFDAVAITVAQFRTGGNKREFRVVGFVTPPFATAVDIFPGGFADFAAHACIDTPGDGLNPILNVQAVPDLALGQSDFDFRVKPLAGTATPTNVCVHSRGDPNTPPAVMGGVNQRAVTIRP